MKTGTKIRLTKIQSLNEISENNLYQETENKEFWWVEGFLVGDIEIGYPIVIFRTANYKNPDGLPGITRTSPVTEVNQHFILTQNTKYKLDTYDS